MAYTKVFAIRSRLDKTVAYAANEKKTGLDGMIRYAVNRSKTEQRLFETALNCESPKTAYAEMCAIKEQYNKTGGVLGYHFIQSFAPGEVTPEQAHQLGVEFAERLFGKRYQVVIGTHLDKKHLHNHIVINSVSLTDGRKYHSSPESYYNDVRGTSDALCAENELSVITPESGGKHYAEWKAEKQGKPTVRGMIRADIDEIMADAFTYKSFLDLLRRRGYQVKAGANVKHTAIRPPGGERFIRLDSLGDGYTEAEIKARLASDRREQPKQTVSAATVPRAEPPRTRYRARIHPTAYKTRKLRGFRALYFKYLYQLRRIRKAPARSKTAFPLKEELLKFDRYQRQFRFLHENRIDSDTELSMYADALQTEIDALTERRKELYRLKRRGDGSVTPEIDGITERLRGLRREQRLCGAIQGDIPHIRGMSNMDERREPEHYDRSKTHEKAHKARPFDFSFPHGGI